MQMMHGMDHIVVYEPDQRARLGFVLSWKAMIENVVNSRELIWQLFKRDLLAGSKQSVLGILWIVISPLVGIVSWVLMNEAGVLHPGALDIPYPLYVLFWNGHLGTVHGVLFSGRLKPHIRRRAAGTSKFHTKRSWLSKWHTP